jgi:3-oxoacyl-[acyl-carrier protein] reductase
MSDAAIGNIDYSDIEVDKTATYDSLKDRVVIITGGGQGIGRGYAHYFAAQGAIPIVADIDGDNAARVAGEVEAEQGRTLAVQCDVGDLRSATEMAEKTLSAFGRIDVLINNAAVFSRITMAPFWELPVDEWERAMQVNITGSFFCARAVVPAMRDAGWGRIVNVSSATFVMGRPNYLHYITSKSAVVGMTRSMARELGPYGITVNTFWPGVMQTEIERPSVPKEMFKTFTENQALPRQGTIHDLAKTMLFICSDEAAYITGQNIQPDGGMVFI